MTKTQKPAQAQSAAPAASFPVSPIIGVVAAVIIFFASQILAEFLLVIYALLRGWGFESVQRWQTDSTYVQFWFVLLVEALTVGLLYMFMRGRRVRFSQLGLRRPRLSDAGVALLAYPPYFLLNAAGTLAAVALFHLNTDQQQQTGFESAKSGLELLATFVSLVILPPIVEEIVMRGFLFGSLKNGMSVARAAIVTSLIFAVAHLQIGSGAPLLWLAAVDTFVLSLVLCYLRQRTGGLWAGMGLHALKNLLAFVTIFIAPNIRV